MAVILADGTHTHFGPLDTAVFSQYLNRRGLEGGIYRQMHALTQDAAEIRKSFAAARRAIGGAVAATIWTGWCR